MTVPASQGCWRLSGRLSWRLSGRLSWEAQREAQLGGPLLKGGGACTERGPAPGRGRLWARQQGSGDLETTVSVPALHTAIPAL